MAFEAIEYRPGDTLSAEHLNEMQSAIVDLSKGVGGSGTHAANTNNPHNVTKAQVGLGNVDNTADANKNVASAKKVANKLVISLDGGSSENYNQCTFDGSSAKTFSITAQKICAEPAVESTDYPGCYYRTVNGKKEWINPPLVPGVEYITTERYNNAPVRKKVVRYERIPTGYNLLSTGLNHKVISVYGTTGAMVSPYFSFGAGADNGILMFAVNCNNTGSEDLAIWNGFGEIISVEVLVSYIDTAVT